MHWRGPAATVNDRLVLSSERKLYKDYDRRCSIEKKISGRESKGARRQDELIGGKTASRKVTLSLTVDSPVSSAPRVEAGSNTTTVAQRVVGGGEKGTQCLAV
jgi:hypothetical protein